MDKLDLRTRLQKPYRREDWMQTAKAVFTNVSFFDRPQAVQVQDQIVKSFNQLGFVRLGDGKSLAMFEVEIDEKVNISRNKVQLRNITTRYIDQENNHGVLVIYDQGKDLYRFTFAAKDSSFTEDMELQVTETPSRRFTYVLGKGEACTTAADRLYDLSRKGSSAKMQDFVEAFNVERLNKEFFKQYNALYEKFWNYIASKDKYRMLFGLKATRTKTDTALSEKPIRDFTKKLLGRIVFLYFLQKKGWMGCPANSTTWERGDHQFLRNLFSSFPKKDKFLSQCLNELFFATLNNNQRKNNLFAITGTRVPYLNGGLFDNDHAATNVIDFPQDYFASLFDFFDQYNFTIDENSPDDQEVGIDPEMLGNIFEYHLEDNREKGAFYTPKEIVHYMCQESILQYLKSHLPEAATDDSDENNELEELVRHHRVGKNRTQKSFVSRNAKRIEELLDAVKICDPAIGSGAFPMGVLKEILNIKLALDMTLDPAKAKKDIIQNTIYGVDIEKGAVDIARLRFWLALVVDETEPHPLPNLDYKIMQGNSLLEQFEGVDLKYTGKQQKSSPKERDLFGRVVSASKGAKRKTIDQQFSIDDYIDISELEEKYFNSNNAAEKQELRKRIESQEVQLVQECLTKAELKYKDALKLKEKELAMDLAASKSKTQEKQILSGKRAKDRDKLMAELEKIQEGKRRLSEIHEGQKPYFLWRLYFKDVFDQGGFDIVIGNPPYVRLQKMKKDADILENSGYDTFDRNADIYCLFYELGFDLLRKNGILTFITSNQWMRAGYGGVLQKFFIENSNPIKLLDFAGHKVFKSATVNTNILIARNSAYENKTHVCVVKDDYNGLINLSDYFRQNETVSSFGSGSWTILSEVEKSIKEKVENRGVPLKDWNIKIYRGILTGYNEAFVISKDIRDKLVSASSKNVEIIRPILRGRDIQKYSTEWNGHYLIGTLPSLNIDINKFPEIKKHLLSFGYDRLKQTGEKGARKKTNNDWYETQDSISYWDDFSRPKIVWKRIGSILRFSYDETGAFCLDSTCFATGQDLKFLIGYLNSTISKKLLLSNSPKTGTGDVITSVQALEPLIVPNATDKQKKEIEQLVEQCLSALATDSGYNTKIIEDKIDNIVYGLFDLSEEEIAYVKSEF